MNKYAKCGFLIFIGFISFLVYWSFFPERFDSGFDYFWGGMTTALIGLGLDGETKKKE